MSATSTDAARTGATQTTGDGRVRRGERNRAGLVDALLRLLEAGVTRPTAKQIAEQAGLSLRTVFQHFDDVESLYAAIADRQRERFRGLYAPLPDGGLLEQRIEALIDRRARLFEQIAPVRRAVGLVSGASPSLERGLRESATALRRQTAALFASELARASRRSDVLAALDVATSWEAWDALRRVRGLSVSAAHRVTRLLVAGVLSA